MHDVMPIGKKMGRAQQATLVPVVGRTLFAVLFLSAGLYKLAVFDFGTGGQRIVEISGMGRRMDDFLGELASTGLPLSTVSATWYPIMMLAAIGLEVIGSILLILDRPLGARMLLLFLASVTPVMHPFWKDMGGHSNGVRGHDDLVQFYKNVSLAGALLLYLDRMV
eukprot:jgi/Picsp_1/1262/NSC_04743-R1_protein